MDDSRQEDRLDPRTSQNADAGGFQDPAALEDVLASIRALVSSETSARLGKDGAEAPLLLLTPDMRVDGGGRPTPAQDGELLVEGLGAAGPGSSAPILDEEALRNVVNRIVREELQGELGDRISRNLRKLIRREMTQLVEQRKES